MGFLRSWVGMVREVGPRNVLIVGFVGSLLSTFFLNVQHAITGDKFFGLFGGKFLLWLHWKFIVMVAL